jgi:hypothetical protein
MVTTQATKKTIWLQMLVNSLGLKIANSTIIFLNNQSGITLANECNHNQMSQH